MRRVLIPNRGEIALRIVRACFDEGLESVVAASEIDMDGAAARLADDAVCLGGPPAADSYLVVERVIDAARSTGCDALHPGYGFLSERAALARACEEAGITFVGPPANVMERSGDKMAARDIAKSLGIPVGGGTDAIASVEDALARAEELGFPLMLKAAAGGGGRGMARIDDRSDLETRFLTSRAEAQQAFGDGRVYVERFVERARHVEVQVLGDRHGNVCHLGERDCSCQRRYQKLIEEAPAVGLAPELVEEIRDAAVRLARALHYEGAGTVEFLVDAERGTFVFLEVNARVQVEHPVTELVTGVDIVREQLRIAAGEPLSFAQEDIVLVGHAVECRINAEDPAQDFRPTPGRLTQWLLPAGAGVRVDSHCQPGTLVSPFYDSLVAKVLTHAESRESALKLMDRVLSHARIEGISTTTPLHRALITDQEFIDGPVTTRWLEDSFLPTWTQEASGWPT